jgi:hypothetical protein
MRTGEEFLAGSGQSDKEDSRFAGDNSALDDGDEFWL